MADLPRVVAVSGSQDFLRRRQVQKTITLQAQKGWKVQVVDGADAWALQAVLNQGGGMFGDNAFVLGVVTNPDKLDLGLLEQHRDDKTSNVTLLLVYEDDPKANTKFGKFLQGLGAKAHMAYPVPEKKWDIPKEAMKFCVAESKALGKPMDESVAEALVKRVGTDYGFLAFEVEKSYLLACHRGQDAIRAEEVRDALSVIGEPSFDGVKDALVKRDRVRLAMALARVKKLAKDPIMGLCGFLDYLVLGKKSDHKPAVGWLQLTVLLAQGQTPESIAGQLGVHAWHCQKNLIPEVKNWTPKDVIALLEITSQSRRAVLNGHVDPWTGFESKLLQICR